MKVNLSGKVVLITGVDNDVGKSIVEKFTEYDASVGIMGLDMDELIKIETEINAKPGGNVFAIRGDVSNADDLANAVWQTMEVFGTLDLAINNADMADNLQNYLKVLMELD